jgi:hypothetical protein
MAFTQTDKINKGALFKNDRKTEPNHAEYKGAINVGGVEYWLDAWINTSKSGTKYMSLKVKPKLSTAPQKAATDDMIF